MASGRRRFETRHGREPTTKHGCRIIGTLSKMTIGVRAAKRGLPPIPAFGIGWLYPVCPTGNATRGRAAVETASRGKLPTVQFSPISPDFIVRNFAGTGLYR